jgi:formylglycine-generating enzyme required for sulfatase activity
VHYTEIDFSEFSKQRITTEKNGNYSVKLPFVVNNTAPAGELFWLLLYIPNDSKFSSWGIFTESGEFICKNYATYKTFDAEYIVQAQENLSRQVTAGNYYLRLTFSERLTAKDIKISVAYSTQEVLDEFRDILEANKIPDETGQSAAGSSPGSNQTFTVDGINFEMVHVPGGIFTMGCTSGQGSDCPGNEKLANSVTLNSYYIGKFEVTQTLWKAVTGNNPSGFIGNNLPVENVSWKDCIDFISKLNVKTGKNFRLPTEVEWEYAACGGNRNSNTKYPDSNDLDNAGWYKSNSRYTTHPVGTKSSNELGIYDMSGNVWEWCMDWYDGYPAKTQQDTAGMKSGSSRVLRGGSWGSIAGHCHVAYRHCGCPDGRYIDSGFRLALSE